MKRKRLVSVILAAAMAFSLAACGSSAYSDTSTTDTSSTDTTSTDTASSDTAASGEASTDDLKIMMETPVESLDPQQATDGTSFEVIADYTDGLMQMDKDGKAVEAIAESYENSDDGLTWTFHLRDAKWS